MAFLRASGALTPAPAPAGRGGRAPSSVRLFLAFRHAGLTQPFDDAGVLRVERRIVGPMDGGPTLHCELGVDFLQLGGCLLRFPLVPGPAMGGGEVDQCESVVWHADDSVVAPFDCLFPLSQMGVDMAHPVLPLRQERITRTQSNGAFNSCESLLAAAHEQFPKSGDGMRVGIVGVVRYGLRRLRDRLTPLLLEKEHPAFQ